jgi:hypothetical protein
MNNNRICMAINQQACVFVHCPHWCYYDRTEGLINISPNVRIYLGSFAAKILCERNSTCGNKAMAYSMLK